VITAEYVGDGRFEPSVSNPITQVVQLPPLLWLPVVLRD
jgi:hypothetical protein